ncbi:ABC transporter ATP-binding protein [Alkalibacterium sp. AK22]|uniref:ABC transporter ATP-binding protein n=1 Tax=Alkalibacterium sp. AK22 TaxID=1229520 RepID=UPI00044682E4|nr:ABC transporter ATP-binding protein [Alkalibacterium sp. AK22]EXJ24368.1 ABC transporter ATP-binding protein [Alkalibacterium sp. AK22]
MNSNCVIELNGIDKKYRQKKGFNKVLKNVNLKINKGEWIAVVGASGAGKSTLLNILGLLENPCRGTYLLDGREVPKKSKYRALLRANKFGFIVQEYALIEKYTVKENLMLPFEYNTVQKNTKLEKEALIKATLSLLNVDNKLDEYAYNLSGGQRQRVAIARALINNPDIILADEPTGALDKDTANLLIEELKKLKSFGKTILMVTHDNSLTQYADRVIEIKEGILLDKRDSIE